MSTERTRLAILGATGHVGKCLTSALLRTDLYRVTAVVRNPEKLRAFLATQPQGAACEIVTFERFPSSDFDMVVNCVGVGKPEKVAASASAVFTLTEHFDQIVLEYLAGRPETRYISFSSGAAYCGDFAQPAAESTPALVPINGIAPADYYGVAKLAAEARHRAERGLAIVDFRLFGLFSRYADLAASYFMCDVYRAIAERTTLTVGPENITRDYIAPSDMIALLLAVMNAEPRNEVYDLYSAAPVAKFDVLEDFSVRYGLQYDVLELPTTGAATGLKPNYYSLNRRAESVGYTPSRTSLETLTEEIDALLELR